MGEIVVDWNTDSSVLNYNDGARYGFAMANFGKGICSSGTNMEYMHPVVKVKFILDLIEIKFGISIRRNGNDDIDNLYIPLLTKKHCYKSLSHEGLSSYNIKLVWDNNEDGHQVLYINQVDRDRNSIWDKDKKAFKKLSAKKISGRLKLTTTSSSEMYLIGFSEGKSPEIIPEQRWEPTDGKHYDIEFKDVEIPYDYFNFAFSAYYGTGIDTTKPMFVSVLPQWDTITFPSLFPIVENLPDMSIGDFLKNIMQLSGYFAYAESANVIRLISVSDFFSKKNPDNSLDWTNKLINESATFNSPAEINFNFSNFAQNNICCWAKDETVGDVFSGAIKVNNANINYEKKAIELKFAGSHNERYTNVAKIPVYNPDYRDNLKPRLLRGVNINGKLGVAFDRLDFPYIIQKYYKEYQEIVANPRVLKVKCLLDNFDISTLDMLKPVYFDQFGHYYAPIKIQTKSNGICDCEMLQL